jgi:hypothetical protein
MVAKLKKWSEHKTISEAFEEAKSEIQSLSEEMRHWEESMSSSDGLSATQKYETVSEAADSLENADLEFEIPDSIKNIRIMYLQISRYGRYKYPRWIRLSNVITFLNTIVDELEKDEKEDTPEGVTDFIDSVHSVIDEIENIEFSGMY